MGTVRAVLWITGSAEGMAVGLALLLNWMMGYSRVASLAVLTAAFTLPLVIAPLIGGMIVLLLEDLESARLALQEQSTHDGLTSLFNRTYFMDRLRREMAFSIRHQTQLSLLIFDADNFKNINDRYGHAVGDKVLQTLAYTCTQLLRENDVLARYGGEEFALLLPATSEEGAWLVAEKLRGAMETMQVLPDGPGERVQITVSIGLTGRRGLHDTVDALFSRADHAMYASKLAGKNQCVLDDAGYTDEAVRAEETTSVFTMETVLAESDAKEIVDVEDAGGLLAV
jgi:diguanylate cyclase (GGDEF)-like protein